MAQTKKKRRRKRRGTQGGRVTQNRPAGRPQSREEAKARARARSKSKGTARSDRPPTWGNAIIRGVGAAVIFTLLVVLLFGRSLASGLVLGAFMFVFYIPAGYYIDAMMWRRRERARIRSERR